MSDCVELLAARVVCSRFHTTKPASENFASKQVDKIEPKLASSPICMQPKARLLLRRHTSAGRRKRCCVTTTFAHKVVCLLKVTTCGLTIRLTHVGERLLAVCRVLRGLCPRLRLNLSICEPTHSSRCKSLFSPPNCALVVRCKRFAPVAFDVQSKSAYSRRPFTRSLRNVWLLDTQVGIQFDSQRSQRRQVSLSRFVSVCVAVQAL